MMVSASGKKRRITMNERNEHHFLFHIFRMDRDENPMPRLKAESLLQYLKELFTTEPKKEKGNDE